VVNVQGWSRSERDVMKWMVRERIHVLGVVEHWMQGMEEVKVAGYQWWGINRRKHRRAKRGSGGVGVLVREDMCKRVMVLEKASDERAMWIRVRGVGEGKDRYVCVVYGECEGMESEEYRDWWEKIEAKVVAFRKKGWVTVMGDFNGRTGKELGENGEETKNTNGEKLIGMVGRQRLVAVNAGVKCVGKWTRILYTKDQVEPQRSVIDYILVEKEEEERVRRVKVEEEEELVSDHKEVWMEIEEAREKVVEKKARRLRWRVEEMKKEGSQYEARLQEEMEGWKEMVAKRVEEGGREEEIVEMVWGEYKGRVMRAMEKGVGKKVVSERAKAWWNAEVEKLRREKGKAYREMRKQEREGGEVSGAAEDYRAKRREYKRSVRKSKRNTWEEFVGEVEEARVKDTKRYWNVVKRLSGGRSTLPEVLEWQGKEVSDEEGRMEAWAGFFEKLGDPQENEEYDEGVKEEVEEEVRRMEKVVLWQRELDLPISDQEVEWGMSNMKAGKAGS
jgi:exonuclease III